MLKAARTAARIANSGTVKQPVNTSEIPIQYNSLYEVKKEWNELSVNHKMPYLQDINDLLFEADHRVIKVSAWLNDTTSHILFYNSEGQCFTDYRPTYGCHRRALHNERQGTHRK